MSSGDESAQDYDYSGEDNSPQQSRISSRQQSYTPDTPRKRRRIESVEPSRVRKYYLEGKYNDAYRTLFNEDVTRTAARFTPAEHVGSQHYTTQYGASTWSAEEQATLFVALERLGKDDVAGIAKAVGTKSIPETSELLLLLKQAAVKKRDLGLAMHDIPAAVEVGQDCTEELDVMAEALAWYQEQWEVAEEQKRYGDHWLITPSIAEDIEMAINGPSRAVSTQPATPAEPETPRIGPGIAGSCERCKRQKIRCDRKIPCTNCARMKKQVVCEYKPSKRTPLSVDPTPQPSESRQAAESVPLPATEIQPQILQAIPQASLLHAQNMLLLSRDLFMNRSPEIPSPWPHWSVYASEQVPEPSIIRTCFNDFHALAVSVTKRLMQTAIIQATSRLRSQRRRSKKGVMPFVKTRDVLSAIDVLGLKRNGRSRWTGVARRCSVRVVDEQRTTRFRIKQREISWDQAEQILGLYDAVTTNSGLQSMASATDSENEEGFRRRAARHGTPLPMEQLSLSKFESDLESDIESGDIADESDSMPSDGTDEELQDAVEEDVTDRSSSLEPEDAAQLQPRRKQTLEQFDQEARRQEEEALSTRLGFTVAVKDEKLDGYAFEDDCGDAPEPLLTTADDWRDWTEYRATWEQYPTAVPLAKFIANQKPLPQPPTTRTALGSDSSTAEQRHRKTASGTIELKPQNPQDYAAMLGSAYGAYNNVTTDESSGTESDVEPDVPAQSIEDTGAERDSGGYNAMDWEA
ncbi:hypothetical protein E8E13_006741 [Curvularia kusanoi]|uniref:Zn(2)-C6 fungal-type domain-containing protein n=1 Tax=Curvularia kusanoi TaxID=90978 RepID=A0A9P4TA58_CURKU|nr:hypothetical protein E8E13_006741 [Curvularia kusanoi]